MAIQPEIHVHVHFYGRDSLTPDIATVHEYAPKKQTDSPPGQLSFDAQSGEQEVPSTTPDKVPITPQLPSDERSQISHTGERNRSLADVDKNLSLYNSRQAYIERIEAGLVKVTSAQLQRAKKNRDTYEDNAKEALHQACGHCTLKCAIRDNYPAWARMHESASVTTSRRESRKDWRDRLLADPEAHCIPPKQSKSKKAA